MVLLSDTAINAILLLLLLLHHHHSSFFQVGTWHSNYCDYIKFYSAAWWLTPVLRRYIQQFYGVIPTTYVPTEFMRLKLTDEG